MLKNILLALILLCQPAYAGTYINFETGRPAYSNLQYASMLLSQRYDYRALGVEFYGGWKTWATYDVSYKNYEPFREVYTFGAKLRVGIFYFKAAHYCGHPVWSGNDSNEFMNYRYYDEMTTYSIGMELKVK